MKTSFIISIALGAAITVSCRSIPSPKSTIPEKSSVTAAATQIGLNSATLVGSFEEKNSAGASYRHLFFRIADNEYLVGADEITASQNDFTVKVSNLKQGTKYWYQFVVSDDVYEVGSPIESFETSLNIDLKSVSGAPTDTLRAFVFDEAGNMSRGWMLAQRNSSTGKWSLPTSGLIGRYISVVTAERAADMSGRVIHYKNDKFKLYWGKSSYLTSNNSSASIQMEALSFLVKFIIVNNSSKNLSIKHIYLEDTSYSKSDACIHFNTYLDTFTGVLSMEGTSSVYWNANHSEISISANGGKWFGYMSFYKDTQLSSGRLKFRLELKDGSTIYLPVPASSWSMGTDYEVSFSLTDSMVSNTTKVLSTMPDVIGIQDSSEDEAFENCKNVVDSY